MEQTFDWLSLHHVFIQGVVVTWALRENETWKNWEDVSHPSDWQTQSLHLTSHWSFSSTPNQSSSDSTHGTKWTETSTSTQAKTIAFAWPSPSFKTFHPFSHPCFTNKSFFPASLAQAAKSANCTTTRFRCPWKTGESLSSSQLG